MIEEIADNQYFFITLQLIQNCRLGLQACSSGYSKSNYLIKTTNYNNEKDPIVFHAVCGSYGCIGKSES